VGSKIKGDGVFSFNFQHIFLGPDALEAIDNETEFGGD
jgi:hypothetical protein